MSDKVEKVFMFDFFQSVVVSAAFREHNAKVGSRHLPPAPFFFVLPARSGVPALAFALRQCLYFCTSKASKLITCMELMERRSGHWILSSTCSACLPNSRSHVSGVRQYLSIVN